MPEDQDPASRERRRRRHRHRDALPRPERHLERRRQRLETDFDQNFKTVFSTLVDLSIHPSIHFLPIFHFYFLNIPTPTVVAF